MSRILLQITEIFTARCYRGTYLLVLNTAEKALNVPFSVFSSPVQGRKNQSFISNASSEYFDTKAGNAQAPWASIQKLFWHYQFAISALWERDLIYIPLREPLAATRTWLPQGTVQIPSTLYRPDNKIKIQFLGEIFLRASYSSLINISLVAVTLEH